MDSVASRYAIALLAVAKENNKVSLYIDESLALIDIFKENEELNLLFKDYGLSSDEKKDVIDNVFKGRFDEYIINLLYVLIDNNRGGFIKSTLVEYVRIANLELNIKKGFVYTTYKLTDDELSKIASKVFKILKSNVTLENKIDKKLIGGFKIEVDDYILDDSIMNRLAKLKLSLKKGEE